MPTLSPTLVLNFAKSKKIDSRASFVRAETTQTATYVDSSGNVVLSGIGAPRFNYDPITLVCKGLRIEEARTNLLTYNNYANLYDLNGASCAANAAVSPSGQVDADLLTNLNAGGLIAGSTFVTPSSTNDYFSTWFIKPMSGQTYVTFNSFYGGNGEDNVDFIFSSLSVNNAPYPNDVIFEKYKNGWYRIGFRLSRDGTGTRNVIYHRLWISGRGITNSASCLVWGSQLELGSFATSMIPTVATPVTRPVEYVTMTGTNFSSWYNQTEGTFVAYGVECHGTYPMIFNVSQNISDTNNAHNVNIGGDNVFQFETYSGGVDVHHNQLAKGSPKKFPYTPWSIVSVMKTNLFKDYVNETLIISDASAALPSSMSSLEIGSRMNTLALNGDISSLIYYNTALSDVDIENLGVQKTYV